MHNDGDREAAKAFIVIVIICIVGSGFYVSRSIGASFTSVLHAETWTIVTLALTAFMAYMMDGAYFSPLVAGAVAVIWPSLWPVLDSAACGGCDLAGRGFMPWETFWWDSGWFKWGVEAALVTIFMWLFIRSVNDPHGYY